MMTIMTSLEMRLTAEMEALRAEHQRTTRDLHEERQRANDYQQEISKLRSRLDDAKDHVAAKEETKAGLYSDLSRTRAALAASEEKARGLAEENAKLRAEIGRWSDYSHERGMRTVDLVESLYASLDIEALVGRFLAWPLPDTVNPDGEYPAGKTREKWGDSGRLVGTNLLSAIEARQMISYLLADAPSWLVEKITRDSLSPSPSAGPASEACDCGPGTVTCGRNDCRNRAPSAPLIPQSRAEEMVAEEREACAKVAEQAFEYVKVRSSEDPSLGMPEQIAVAIRERQKKETGR